MGTTRSRSRAPFGNGVNLQPSYYNNGLVSFGWELMAKTSKIHTLRIEIEPDKATEARSWIQQACGHGYDVIATYHNSKANGSDLVTDLTDAAKWWADNYRNLLEAPIQYMVQKNDDLRKLAERFYGDAGKYNKIANANRAAVTKPNVIRAGQILSIPPDKRSLTINLMNEWGSHNLTAKQYAQAYRAAIATVRHVYDKAIIIDVPGWAQETAVAAAAVKGIGTGGVTINDTNIILSVHIYPSANLQHRTPGAPSVPENAMCNADLDDLAAAGPPCMVGEFGSVAKKYIADWSSLVDHAKSLGWPILGWAWNGDGETPPMNMVSPPWPANPSGLSSYFKIINDKL